MRIKSIFRLEKIRACRVSISQKVKRLPLFAQKLVRAISVSDNESGQSISGKPVAPDRHLILPI